MRIPAAVQTIDARRVGSDVYVTLGVPAQNIDASTPAAVSRIEVYGYTGVTPPPRGRFLEGATVVATIDVVPAPGPGELAGEAAAVTPGMAVTIRDSLAPDELVAAPAVPARTAPGPSDAGPPRRFYMAIAFNDRRVPGPPGTVTGLPLTTTPDPPTDLTASYTADAVTLSWQASGGLMAFLLSRALPPEPPPFDPASAPAEAPPDAASPPPGPAFYNVYRDIAPDPLALAAPADEARGMRAPQPLNPAPLERLTFTEPVILDERERCYTVRTVRGAPPDIVEGDPSPRVCVTPLDVFAPATPAGVVPIASAAAISLIWEPNTEADLAGYLVLRGEAGGDTLTLLTRVPVRDAQFTDDTVTPGVRYVYEVVAVDARLPLPNMSAPARVEEAAR